MVCTNVKERERKRGRERERERERDRDRERDRERREKREERRRRRSERKEREAREKEKSGFFFQRKSMALCCLGWSSQDMKTLEKSVIEDPDYLVSRYCRAIYLAKQNNSKAISGVFLS